MKMAMVNIGIETLGQVDSDDLPSTFQFLEIAAVHNQSNPNVWVSP